MYAVVDYEVLYSNEHIAGKILKNDLNNVFTARNFINKT